MPKPLGGGHAVFALVAVGGPSNDALDFSASNPNVALLRPMRKNNGPLFLEPWRPAQCF